MIRLLALYRHDKPTIAAVVAVFAQVNSLPGSQTWSATGDRDVKAVAEDAGFQVRGQIVRSLVPMQAIRLGFGYGVVEVALEILTHRGIGMRVNDAEVCMRNRFNMPTPKLRSSGSSCSSSSVIR